MAWRVVGAASLALAATLWWLLRARTRIGRDDWFLTPSPPWPFAAWPLPVFVLVLLGGLAALSTYDRFRRAKTSKEQRSSTRLAVGALMLLAFLWPWLLLGPGARERPGVLNLVSTFWSDTSNQYFGRAFEVVNAREFSRQYADTQQSPPSRAQSHVATHPPGAVLAFYGARKFYEATPPLQTAFEMLSRSLLPEQNAALVTLREERAAVARSAAVATSFPLPNAALPFALFCAALLTLAVASTTPAIFQLASAGSSDDAARDARGLLAAGLWALSPSVQFFAFTLDALLMCVAAWSLAFYARRIGGGKPLAALIAGAVWGFGTWLSFGLLALSALFFFATGLRRRARPWLDFAWLAGGFALMWLLLLILFPTPILRVFDQAMDVHRSVTLVTRARWPWAGLNLLYFALFAGWPLAVLALAGAWRSFRPSKNEVEEISSSTEQATPEAAGRLDGQVRDWSTSTAIGAAALLAIVLLTISGSVRGEVERLWLFLLPPLGRFERTKIASVAGVSRIARSSRRANLCYGCDARADGAAVLAISDEHKSLRSCSRRSRLARNGTFRAVSRRGPRSCDAAASPHDQRHQAAEKGRVMRRGAGFQQSARVGLADHRARRERLYRHRVAQSPRLVFAARTPLRAVSTGRDAA
jgi:hypothetical protein